MILIAEPLLTAKISSLSKQERLTSRKQIKLLFREGYVLRLYPLKVFYLKKERQEDVPTHKVLFVVPKKSISSAVGRNRIKRLLREAYRLQKHTLYAVSPISPFVFLIGYVYTGKEEGAHYPVVSRAVFTSLQYLSTLLHKS